MRNIWICNLLFLQAISVLARQKDRRSMVCRTYDVRRSSVPSSVNHSPKAN